MRLQKVNNIQYRPICIVIQKYNALTADEVMFSSVYVSVIRQDNLKDYRPR